MARSPHPDPAALLAEAREAWSGELRTPPAALVGTRRALHRVAEGLLAPARQAATGNEIALRFYPGGFGTPPFRDDLGHRSIRVEGTELVDVCDGREIRQPLHDLRGAGRLVGDLVDAHALPADPLAIDAGAAEFLADWFAFATVVVAGLRIDSGPELDPGWVQLWPEHFDVATELGAEADGARAGYGASPGDDDHDEPYLYVAPWSAPSAGEIWNASGFGGAELSYEELRDCDDPAAAAASFFADRLNALAGPAARGDYVDTRSR